MELLVTIVIGSIVALSAMPAYHELRSSIDRNAAVNQFEADLMRARTSARAEGARMILTINEGFGYTFGIDRLPFNDPVSSDEKHFTTTIPLSVELETDGIIIFDSRGRLIDEDGALTQRTTSLSQTGEVFSEHTIYASGFVEKLN